MLEMDNRGQVSAEFLVLLAAVLALALLVVLHLSSTSKTYSKEINKDQIATKNAIKSIRGGK